VLGAEASLWTRLGGNRLGLVVDGSWFDFSQTQLARNSNVTVDIGATYLALTAAPTWRQPIGRRFMLWASVGGGVVRVASSSKVEIAGQPAKEESSWVPAGTASLSIGAKVFRGYPFLELRGTLVGNPNLTSLVGSFTPVFLQLGYRFDAL